MKKAPSKKAVVAPPPIPNPNHLQQYREELGLPKTELARLADLTDKTIGRVEKAKEAFRRVTYRKILIALNKARKSEAMAPLELSDVFPTLE
jgi:predicted transcriptional regulator